jgi:hypothetical protein
MVAAPELIEVVLRIKQPYNINIGWFDVSSQHNQAIDLADETFSVYHAAYAGIHNPRERPSE